MQKEERKNVFQKKQKTKKKKITFGDTYSISVDDCRYKKIGEKKKKKKKKSVFFVWSSGDCTNCGNTTEATTLLQTIYRKKKNSGVHPRVSTLIQPSFQKKKKKKECFVLSSTEGCVYTNTNQVFQKKKKKVIFISNAPNTPPSFFYGLYIFLSFVRNHFPTLSVLLSFLSECLLCFFVGVVHCV